MPGKSPGGLFPRPASVVSRKFVSIHDTTFPAFQAGNHATSSVMNFWFRTLEFVEQLLGRGGIGHAFFPHVVEKEAEFVRLAGIGLPDAFHEIVEAQ